MIAVDQTTFGFPGGNCFSACIASLLEIALDDVPYFMSEPDSEWYDRFRAWLEGRGWYPLCLQYDGERPTPGLHILSGLSPRAADGADPERYQHSVVARGRKIVHDPHPSRDGLRDRRDVIVLVPLDPARLGGTP
jgi:hypothetical protein